MQGGQDRGGVPVSGAAGEAGPDPLPPAAGGQRADGRGPSTLRDSTPSCPHPGELGGGWGEFEGFRESSAQSQQSSPSFELLGSGPSAPRELGSRQGGPWGTGTAAAASPSEEPLLSYENAFRFAFQEVPVEQAPEDVCPLDRFLEISCEENPSLAPIPRLCSESRKLWRALQNPDTVPSSPCLWSESRCRENLFPILGIDPAQKSLSGGQSHVLEGSDLREPEELLAVSSFHLHHCKALIPTKLSGTPGNTQGSLITYSLFLKTPPHGNGHCITIPRKKIFMPRSLKMAFFNNGVG